jgi:hypothetical protein
MSRSSFGKRDRDQAKKAKAQAKRERRQAAGEAEAEATPAGPDDGLSTSDLLQMIEDVHRLHEAGGIGDDDFQARKAELLGRLSVD